jgi:hypothetical protein
MVLLPGFSILQLDRSLTKTGPPVNLFYNFESTGMMIIVDGFERADGTDHGNDRTTAARDDGLP